MRAGRPVHPLNVAERVLGGGPGDVALTDDAGASLTYGELAEQVGTARGGLVAAGVAPGSRVAIRLRNSADFVVAYLAVLGAGAVAVPLDPDSAPAELGEHLERSAVELIMRERDEFPASDPVPVREVEPSRPALLCDTAGTCGPPRSAVLTHGNLSSVLHQMVAHPRSQLRRSDVVLGVLPLFHVLGLQIVTRSLASGAQVRLRSRFDAAEPLDGVTVVVGAPSMFQAWATTAARCDDARMVISGGAPLPEATARRFEGGTGKAIAQGYGLTESSGVATSGLLLDQPDPLSVGVPLPGIGVRLVDADGIDVAQEDEGEIWVKGPNVFAGYDRDPRGTAEVFQEGWLRTGDVGTVDERGRLYVVDRLKDVVIVSGFTVYPGEVEEALVAHPGVARAAAVGMPDPQTGQAVRAVVVTEEGRSPSEVELIAWCRSRLARYKCPREVRFIEDLPTLPTGKVLRRLL